MDILSFSLVLWIHSVNIWHPLPFMYTHYTAKVVSSSFQFASSLYTKSTQNQTLWYTRTDLSGQITLLDIGNIVGLSTAVHILLLWNWIRGFTACYIERICLLESLWLSCWLEAPPEYLLFFSESEVTFNRSPKKFGTKQIHLRDQSGPKFSWNWPPYVQITLDAASEVTSYLGIQDYHLGGSSVFGKLMSS